MLRILFFCYCTFFFIDLSAQVSGTVADENGATLPYVSVYVRGTSNGTSANGEGVFRLNIAPGKHELVFQYIGYKQHIEPITVTEKPLRLSVRMQPDELVLAEVEIRDEDPAYRIMRQAIEKRSYYRYKIKDYSCDAYVKGFHQMMDAPKKIMGKDIGNMGGILDTNRTGVLYLSESVSKVYVQDKKLKEVMISSKVSGDNNGLSFNRAMAADFTFYDERLDIIRDILSPLADNAFAYYKFQLVGKFKDRNDYTIYKIKVIPKRPADPVFAGFLYIADDWYHLAGADLFLTGAAIKQPVLDTLRIHQEFVPLVAPDTWVMLSQVTSFKFGLMGFKIQGLFNGVFSNYNITPQFGDNFFNRETFKVEKDANVRDSAYWSAIRPVPLTPIEQRDYVRKDSLRQIWDSKPYKDSIDRKNNKFSPFDLLTGYSWNNSWKRLSIDWPPAFNWLQFNTVQGLVFDIHPTIYKSADERNTRFWRAEGILNYGFSEKKMRGGLSLRRRFESIYYSTAEISGGLLTEQFNSENPITPLANTIYTLQARKNFLKIYEKAFLKASFRRRVVPGLLLRVGLEYADRSPLRNTTDYSFNKKSERDFTINDIPGNASKPEWSFFTRHQAFIADIEAEFRFGEEYSTYPKFRSYNTSKWPILTLRYRGAFQGVAGSDVGYNFVRADIRQNDISWGLVGYSNIRLAAGAFVQKKQLQPMDAYFPLGNQILFANPNRYNESFQLLPYYEYGTEHAFVEGHWQHHLEGWLLDKIPGLRRLNWKEVLGARLFMPSEYRNPNATFDAKPYWELNFGFENIGWKAIRPLRVDVVTGFFGAENYRTSVVLGIGFN
jgi:hypothetical protein